MKMNRYLLPLAACSALMLSCAEEQETAPITQGKVTFEVPDFEEELSVDTRMAVTISSAGAAFNWTAGDTLGVFPDEGYQTAFPISDGTGTSSAEFDGGAWALRTSTDYAAYYPFQHPMDAVNKRAIAVSYVGQCQLGNNMTTHLGDYDYLAAPFTEVSSTGNTTFSFAHMGALVRLRLYVPASDSYSSVTLKSIGTKFVTAGTFDLTATSPALSATATSDAITLDLTNVSSDAADDLITLYLMVAPANLSSAQIAVTLAGATKNYLGSVTGKNYEAGTIYSHTVELEAEASSEPVVGDHAYVDLGLPSGLKWATCNIGATKPEEYGDYFAWGETTGYNSGKITFNWSTYKYCNGDYNKLTKYCNNSSYGNNGFTDTKTTLDLADDAARANWGGSWRMPTHAEQEELINNCTTTWTTVNGVYGRLFISKTNGKTLFLPAAGYRGEAPLFGAGSFGYYWSSSLYSGSPFNAWLLLFGSSDVYASSGSRYYGRSVRAVWSESVAVTSVQVTSDATLVNVGETLQLSVNVLPTNASNKTVTWSSSNEDLATVSSNGLVTAVAAGSVIITATANDGSGVCGTYEILITVPDDNGHDYVDLGLPSGLKWATCNIGATKPEEYGDYFAWGETTGYNSGKTTTFSWSNYKYCNGDYNKLTKYCDNSTYGNNGFTDTKTTLDLADDAARANWGGSWRMPTQEECKELINNCTTTWTTENGVYGRLFTSKTNGKTLFLPAAGLRSGSSLVDAGSFGYYWSSSLISGYPYIARTLDFYSTNVTTYNNTRYYGQSVRAVCSASK